MVGAYERTDHLQCDVREVDRKSWKYFSKYHYLSDKLPGGKIYTFGLFSGVEQIGFQCFAAYIIGDQRTYFSNRTVIHPDYAGLGLGVRLINETSKIMHAKGFRIKAKFSSVPIFKALTASTLWRCVDSKVDMKAGSVGDSVMQKQPHRSKSIRNKQRVFHFDFIG